MKFDVILAGVGGQGVLSVSAIIAASALEQGLLVKQSEVHGMAQRGGAVLAHLRISDEEIHSDLVPRGTADLLLSMEPLESLRYVDYLAPDGAILASTSRVENIPEYPQLDAILEALRGMPRTVTLDAGRLARESGSTRATNVVMVGAASHVLPVDADKILGTIDRTFARKGEAVREANRKAFGAGRGSVR